MRITIKDLAEYCGVSSGTVDRALNNRPGIKLKTKQKILEAVQKLNYRPDFTARSLVKGRTMTLGIVLFDLYNRSFAQLLNAVELKAKQYGYFIYVALTNKDPVNEKQCIEYLANHKVDGMILFTVHQGKEFEQYLESFPFPIIMIFNFLSERWQYIGIHERAAMRDVAFYIADKGYTQITYICPPLSFQGQRNIFTQEERLKGLMEGLSARDINHVMVIKQRDYLDVLDGLVFKKGLMAIVCSCDLYALEVMNHFKKKEIRIPEDVGLMGFDHIDVLKYISPKLTTVEYPVEEIGKMAVESLIHKMEAGKLQTFSPICLDFKIIEGESI